MNNVDFNQMLEFFRSIQVIIAIAIVLGSAGASIAVAVITAKNSRKTKAMELFFDHQLKAYQGYMRCIYTLISLMRKDVSAVTNIAANEGLRKYVIDEFLPTESNALMFADKKLSDLICDNDAWVSKLVVAKDADEFKSLSREINIRSDQIIECIQMELRAIKK